MKIEGEKPGREIGGGGSHLSQREQSILVKDQALKLGYLGLSPNPL